METQPDMNLVIAANLKALRTAKQLSLGEAQNGEGNGGKSAARRFLTTFKGVYIE